MFVSFFGDDAVYSVPECVDDACFLLDVVMGVKFSHLFIKKSLNFSPKFTKMIKFKSSKIKLSSRVQSR